MFQTYFAFLSSSDARRRDKIERHFLWAAKKLSAHFAPDALTAQQAVQGVHILRRQTIDPHDAITSANPGTFCRAV